MAACPCNWLTHPDDENRVEEFLHLVVYRKEVGEGERDRKRGRGRRREVGWLVSGTHPCDVLPSDRCYLKLSEIPKLTSQTEGRVPNI